jgi:hypothetical protein
MIVVEIIRFNVLFAALFNLLHLLVWNYVATFTAVALSNLPVLRPLVFKRGFWGTSKNSNGSSSRRLGSSNGYSRGGTGMVTTGTNRGSEDSEGFPLADVGAPTEVIVTRSAKVEVSSKSDFENKV